MTELIQESTLAEYEAFVQSHPKGHFAQSSLWAKQKPAWKWRAIVSRGADGRIRGSIAFLIRTMPYIHKTMLYACRGPVCDLDDRETFGELVAAARELAKEYKAYVIKIDPDVPVENEDFRRMLEDFGFSTRHGGKNFEAIQPKFVFRLWLNGRTEDELMASFHQKWRYNIRLAVKKGVEVRVCGKEMVPDFARIMLTTGVRDGFVTRPPEYFCQHARQPRRARAAVYGLPRGPAHRGYAGHPLRRQGVVSLRSKLERAPQPHAELSAAVEHDPVGR